MSAIEIRNVKKRYKELQALKGVNLVVEEGEFFGLLGPNGAGKTTLISILAGLARADSGAISVLGHDVVSDDINLLFRILDARPLRTALASTGAGLALAISGPMYDSVGRGHPALVGPDPPRHINTTVKGTKVNAWIYVPGAPLRRGLERHSPSPFSMRNASMQVSGACPDSLLPMDGLG